MRHNNIFFLQMYVYIESGSTGIFVQIGISTKRYYYELKTLTFGVVKNAKKWDHDKKSVQLLQFNVKKKIDQCDIKKCTVMEDQC